MLLRRVLRRSLSLSRALRLGGHLSAPSPGDDLRLKLAIRLRGQTVRSDLSGK